MVEPRHAFISSVIDVRSEVSAHWGVRHRTSCPGRIRSTRSASFLCMRSYKCQSNGLVLFVSKLLERNNLHHVYQSRGWMSSRSVCVHVILHSEHSSLLVMLLLGVVIGGGICRYFVVVVLCNVGFLQSSITCFAYGLFFPIRRDSCSNKPCIIVFSDHYCERPQFLHLSQTLSRRLPISLLVFLLSFEFLST